MGRTPSPASRRRREKDRSERKKRRERARDRSREREREKEPRRHRSRSRERSRERGERSGRRRSRSRSKERAHPSTSRGKPERPEFSEADLEGKTPEEIEMMKTMGFCTFDTTKNKKVEGNDAGEVHVILKPQILMVQDAIQLTFIGEQVQSCEDVFSFQSVFFAASQSHLRCMQSGPQEI
ncbi:unnamed protein product [Hermetia illucens]|uniref:U4/U6.U5 small nuclear ribonucleoprotein 27 kDa protein n=1 Tax=Hermetia illucens TaxID=343691 RepID=A0A7R8YYB2_HERIL|nr:unnamed protein product [Hermetia illucens]